MGVERSPKFSIPSTPSGKSLKYVYIKSIYVSNSNQRFGSGTFQTLKSGSAYYIISKGATWPEGGTTVNGTHSFVVL